MKVGSGAVFKSPAILSVHVICDKEKLDLPKLSSKSVAQGSGAALISCKGIVVPSMLLARPGSTVSVHSPTSSSD